MFLGVDLGTGSVKALVLDRDGQTIGTGSVRYTVSHPAAGWAESDPGHWWKATCEAIRQAVGDRGRAVQAIGLSGQMHGVVVTDVLGVPLRPAILWADTRSYASLDRYDGLTPTVRAVLANPIVCGMAGPSLLWLQEHEPNVYNGARWSLQPKDWIRHRLTGQIATDPSDASATLLYDLPEDGWAFRVIDDLGLRADLLPGIFPSDAPAGVLKADVADDLGLRAGIPVAVGAGDTAAAALGTGATTVGVSQLTTGTAGQIIVSLGDPIPDASLRTHLYRAALPRQWYAMSAVQNVGLALEWVRSVFGVSWDDVYREAFAMSPGADGLLFLPYVSGERTPVLDPNARGAWVGLAAHHTRGHVLRASLEGVAFALKDGLEALEDRGLHIPELRLSGGGSLDTRWRVLLSTVLQRRLHSLSEGNASARGAAMLGGMAHAHVTGEDMPQNDHHPVLHVTEPDGDFSRYEEAYRRYQTLYPRLRGV